VEELDLAHRAFELREKAGGGHRVVPHVRAVQRAASAPVALEFGAGTVATFEAVECSFGIAEARGRAQDGYLRGDRIEEGIRRLGRVIVQALAPAEARPLVSPIPEEEEPPHIDLSEPTEAEEAALPPDFPEEEAPQMDEKTGIPEIVTPTLAEVYYGQGQLEKAIEIYERVMDTDPEDEKSRHRLTALRAELRPIPTDEKLEAEKGIMEKNKKLIAILESWLDNIRQMTDSSETAERI